MAMRWILICLLMFQLTPAINSSWPDSPILNMLSPWRPGCTQRGLLSGRTGVISSPNYPQNYGPNADCSWIITGPPGTRSIVLHFESFGTDPYGYDYVEIHNGNSPTSPLLKKLNGHYNDTFRVVSNGTSMFVRFRSSGTGNYKGFRAVYTVPIAGCRDTILLSGLTGVISSPNYPQNYGPNASCSWIITAPPGARSIVLHFESFSTDPYGYDYVEIRNGNSSTSPLIKKLNGHYNDTFRVVSNGTSMFVHFRSNGSGNYKGFRAVYTVPIAGCRDTTLLSGLTGVISSPNYPQNYGPNADCSWIITAPPDARSVVLYFESFSTDPYGYDYVEIRNGNSSTSSLLKKLNGHYNDTFRVVSNGTSMFVRFRSNGSGNYKGFRAVYTVPIAGITI